MLFLPFEQSFMCFFQLKKTLHKFILYIFLKLDPDPHLKSSWIRIRIKKKPLDPSPQKMNADPQPWRQRCTELSFWVETQHQPATDRKRKTTPTSPSWGCRQSRGQPCSPSCPPPPAAHPSQPASVPSVYKDSDLNFSSVCPYPDQLLYPDKIADPVKADHLDRTRIPRKKCSKY